MAFADYTELIEPLELPIRGKKYVIPPMSFEAGLKASPLLEGKVPEGLSNSELESLILGSAVEELRADGVPDDAIYRAMITALAEYRFGRPAAEIMWASGGDPKAMEARVRAVTNRATRRKASKPSTSTGEAKKTR